MATSRRRLIDWLLENGFTELQRRATSHRQFMFKGFKFAVPDHGSQDIEPKVITLLAKNLAPHGFDPKRIKQELL